MQTVSVNDAEAWAQQQFGAVHLGDARLDRRVPEVAMRMAIFPGASLPRQMKDRAQLRATYGLLHNEKVTHAGLDEPHWQATRRAAAEQPLVLLVMDITELDLTRYSRTMKGVGYLRPGGCGQLVHSTLAVIPEPRQVLGLTHQQVFERVPIPEGEKRRQRPPQERESRVWGEALEAMGAAPGGSCQVVVGDRATDFAAFLQHCDGLGYGYCVRLVYNRRMMTDLEGQEAKYLLDDARTWPPVAKRYVDLSATSKRKARRAKLHVSYGEVTVRGPERKGSLGFWVVRAWEADAPEGVEPVEWFLATNVPVRSAKDALQRLDWYTCRWVVEDYHKCLKTGCGMEERDLEDVESVKRLLGFLGPLAVRLLQLRENARLNPDLPATAVADDMTIRILAAEREVPAEKMTVRAFWRHVAGMGGFQGRRSDGEPGWRSLWEGWLRLEALVRGANLARALALI